MNPSPLSQPAAQTCLNCGAGVNAESKFCPSCTAGVEVRRNPSEIWVVFLQIVLGLIAVGATFLGICFFLIGTFGIPQNGWFYGAIPVVGAVAITGSIATACIRGIIRLNKSSK